VFYGSEASFLSNDRAAGVDLHEHTFKRAFMFGFSVVSMCNNVCRWRSMKQWTMMATIMMWRWKTGDVSEIRQQTSGRPFPRCQEATFSEVESNPLLSSSLCHSFFLQKVNCLWSGEHCKLPRGSGRSPIYAFDWALKTHLVATF